MPRLLPLLVLLVASGCFVRNHYREGHHREAVSEAYSAANLCKVDFVEVQDTEIANTYLARGCGKPVQLCRDTGEWTCGPLQGDLKWQF